VGVMMETVGGSGRKRGIWVLTRCGSGKGGKDKTIVFWVWGSATLGETGARRQGRVAGDGFGN